jgi:hypothetical protein
MQDAAGAEARGVRCCTSARIALAGGTPNKPVNGTELPHHNKQISTPLPVVKHKTEILQ